MLNLYNLTYLDQTSESLLSLVSHLQCNCKPFRECNSEVNSHGRPPVKPAIKENATDDFYVVSVFSAESVATVWLLINSFGSLIVVQDIKTYFRSKDYSALWQKKLLRAGNRM